MRLGGPPAPALRLRLLLAGLPLLLVACGESTGSRKWNVLLVTFDTTRVDRIGAFGDPGARTPTLDRLAAEGVRFTRTMSSVPVTAPSHSTILTGRYPIAHGVRDNGLFRLDEKQETLAEILGRHGYATAAAVASFPLTRQFGFDQGFDLFDDHLTGAVEDYRGERAIPKTRLFFDERRAAQVNEAILPWLEGLAARPDGAPFFAWVHYFDPHQPFEPPPPYDQLHADDLYAGEIAYADASLGFLLERLGELGELDRTLVVMTADHGEGLGDHGELTHAVLAYGSTLHVPLIFRPPGELSARGRAFDQGVGTVDIVPTILDLLEIEPPEGLQGRSLVPVWEGSAGSRPRDRLRYAENLSPRFTHGWGELRVLFEDRLKYIHGPEPELYDLEADPRELDDLVERRPDEARRMRDLLEAFLAREAVPGSSTTETLDEPTRQRLEALGYLHTAGGGGEVIQERLRSDGLSPRDRVGDVNDLSAAKQLLFQGRFQEALVYTDRLVRGGPETPLYLDLHVQALLRNGRTDAALEIARRHQDDPVLAESSVVAIAARLSRDARTAEAAELLERHLDRSPGAAAWVRLAEIHRREGRDREARHALEEALELDSRLANARLELAVVLAILGDGARAEVEFRRVLADLPYAPRAFYNFGTFLLQSDRPDEAETAFVRAVELAPGYLAARVAVVATRLATGDPEGAEAALRDLVEIAPDSPEASTAAELLDSP